MRNLKSILGFLDDPELFAPLFPRPETWTAWRAFLAALYALPLTEEQLKIYRDCTGRTEPAAFPYHEAYVIAGRRGGKSRTAALIASYEAIAGDWASRLAPGERAKIFVISTDRNQSGVVLGYIKGTLERFPELVASTLSDEVRLTNGVDVAVKPCTFRASRGFSTACVICDEIAFWRDENSANPAEEVIASLLPSLMEGGLLLGISTPYAKMGYLYDAYKGHYAQEFSDILVWKAPTLVMNPTYPEQTIRKLVARDKTVFLAEYNADFREDIEAFLPEALVDLMCVRQAEPSNPDYRYSAFIDPSGGSRDSMTLAIARQEGEKAILVRTEERRPPFDPAQVAKEFSAVLKSYGVHHATADRYGGEWVVSAFRQNDITITVSPMPASDLYLEFAPLARMNRLELLDDERLKLQLRSLERRPTPSGKDRVDHAPAGHDDLANAVAGAIVMAVQRAPWSEKEMEAHLPQTMRKENPINPMRKQTLDNIISMEDEMREFCRGSKIVRK